MAKAKFEDMSYRQQRNNVQLPSDIKKNFDNRDFGILI